MRTDPREACANERQRLGWALVHDGLAHPLMALTGYCKLSLRFHDWTSHKAWPRAVDQDWRWPVMTTSNLREIEQMENRLRDRGLPFVVTATPWQTGPLGVDFEYVYQLERIA